MIATKDIFGQNRIDPAEVKRSSDWFSAQIKKIQKQNLTPGSIMNSGVKQVNRIMPGKMYFFYYDPKYKDTLPYYDRFPLVLPFDRTADSFIGLNLHYLDYKNRMILFQELAKIGGTRHFNDEVKMRYSWNTIKSMSKLKMAAPCVKRYLGNHVKTQFYEVPSHYWHTAIMLPVQRFEGANKEFIWKESVKKS